MGNEKNELKMTELTYNDNNCTFLYVVSTPVDGAEGGGQMWRNYWGQQDVAVCDRGQDGLKITNKSMTLNDPIYIRFFF